jgi:hypothetical protein
VVNGWVKGVQERSEVRTAIQLVNYTLEVHHSKAFCLQQFRSARLVQLEFMELHQRLTETMVSEMAGLYSK